MPIADDVLPGGNGNGRGQVIDQRTSPYDTSPGAIRNELDAECARHDRLTEAYGDAYGRCRRAEHQLAVAKARAREVAKRRPNPKDRRTTDDIAADVTLQVEEAEAEFIAADVQREALRTQLRNCERNIERLRTHEATARQTDYRGP